MSVPDDTLALDLEREFPRPMRAAWEAEVTRALGGRGLETLRTHTLEGIAVEPLYTAEDAPDGASPGISDVTTARTWQVAQEIALASPVDVRDALAADLARGQTAVGLRVDEATERGLDPDQAPEHLVGANGTSIGSLEDLRIALEAADPARVPVYVRAGGSSLAIAGLLDAVARLKPETAPALRGALLFDPMAVLVRPDQDACDAEPLFDQLAAVAEWAEATAPAFRTVCASGVPWREAGGHAVHEVAFVLASGVESLRALETRGLGLERVAARLVFETAVGLDFFMELAKLRALRLAWTRVVDAAGGSNAGAAVPVHARTLEADKTRFDPHTNILRGTTQALAAVLGGCDSLHVTPFDAARGAPSELARRVARNTQLILRDESRFGHVVNPAAGAWLVESLTREIAQEAWRAFQAIEAEGGMTAALQKGLPQRWIAGTNATRAGEIATRHRRIVGVTCYADPDEAPPDPGPQTARNRLVARARERRAERGTRAAGVDRELRRIHGVNRERLVATVAQAAAAGATLGELATAVRSRAPAPPGPPIPPLHPIRMAASVEAIRLRVQAWRTTTGRDPLCLILTLADPSALRARLAFVRDVLDAGGFSHRTAPAVPTAAGAIDETRTRGVAIVVLAGRDEQYVEAVPELARQLKALRPAPAVLVAGRPPGFAHGFSTAGVDDFLHQTSDVVSLLDALSARLGAS